jgi:hypothetical protein
MKYEAKWWSRLLSIVEKRFPIRFDFTEARPPPHPWEIRPLWHKDKKAKYGEWRGIVTAGLVNAMPTYVEMIYEEASDAARERVRLSALAAKKPQPKPTDRVKIYLDEQAELKFNWRALGVDAFPESISGNSNSGGITGVFEKVPEFFKKMGVADANPKISGEVPTTIRLLKACDIVLNQPRTSLTNNTTISAETISTSLVSINPGFQVPPDREPYLNALPKFLPRQITPKFDDLILNRFTDTALDQFHLSTAYLLSPVLPLLNPSDLEGWQVYLKYNCHHNLVHATQQIEKRTEFVPLTLTIPLAGGLAQPSINYILAENNFFAQAALDFYQQRKLNGKFYAI